MSQIYKLVYEFVRAMVQVLLDADTATSATDTLTATAHGLAVGDTIKFTDVNGLVTISTGTRYFVVAVPTADTFKISATYGGSPISVGTGSDLDFQGLHEIQIPWANQAGVNAENTSYVWEGDATRKELTLLRSLSITFAAASIPDSAHAEIFDKAAITGALPGGMTNVRSYGGGNDQGGASVGFRLEGYALKYVDGVESRVDFARWFPVGTLTYTTPGQLQTGQTAGTTGYSFSATRTTVDLLGLTITGSSTGGEFFYEGEI